MTNSALSNLLEAAAEAGELDAAYELISRHLGRGAAVAAQKRWTGRLEDGGPSRTGEVVRLSDVEPETVRWLWADRIPLGKLTILDGDPGLGKSTLSLDLAARLSTGQPMPDGARPDVDGPRGTVLMSAEDGIGDTIRPRLDAADANVDRVAALRMVWDEAAEDARLPTVHDLREIRQAVREVDAALLIVDPLVAYLGSNVNSYRDQDVRSALAGLSDLADTMGVAVLAIRHLRKSGGSNPKHVGGGSIGLIAAARAGLLVAEDPDDPEERRVLAATKMNLAPEPDSLSYRMKAAAGTVRIAWEGESDHTASDLLDRPSKEERTAREEAEHVLREQLSDGAVPVKDLQALADRLGISWRTFRRAKKKVGAEQNSTGFGDDKTWYWRLPGQGAWPPKADNDLADKTDGPDEQGSSGDGGPLPGQRSDVADKERNAPPKFEGF